MASKYFGVDVGGQTAADVTIDSSTTSSDVELVVDDSAVIPAAQPSKRELLDAVEAIRLAIIQDDY